MDTAGACYILMLGGTWAGHTHFCWDETMAGVRYVQWPLAYPQERACVPLPMFRFCVSPSSVCVQPCGLCNGR